MSKPPPTTPEKRKLLADLTFNRFKELAGNPTLSRHEKIGFFDALREGFDEAIFGDIAGKLTNLALHRKVVIDIGSGCGDLALKLIAFCREHEHMLILIDSAEMLDQLPDSPLVQKVSGAFPADCVELLREHAGKADVVITYSVFHYVFAEGSPLLFVDHLLSLLAEGGQCLIGDIPNDDKRKRFFDSATGRHFHRVANATASDPDVEFNRLEIGMIDDATLLGIAARCRNFGFDAYLVQQSASLPMANRREDLLIIRP